MKNFKEHIKVWSVRIGLVVLFLAGFMVRPTFDRTYAFTMDIFAPKTFIAPTPVKNEFDQEVANYMDTDQAKNLCLNQAKSKVAADFTKKYDGIYGESTDKANAITHMINNDISPETAKATVAIEKAQGRGK